MENLPADVLEIIVRLCIRSAVRARWEMAVSVFLRAQCCSVLLLSVQHAFAVLYHVTMILKNC